MTEPTADQTFYWYDFETFGLSRRTDRPCQFAGRRTDMDFNPVGEEDVFYEKPADDYLPSPESVMITGITPQECLEKGLPESDFAREIWDRFNEPGTVSIGYNTLGFDDEVARFLFWRNLLPPYSHMWKNACSRWDLFPLVVALWALRREESGINWPAWKDVVPESKKTGVTFKLEYLSKANGLEHDHAHDAMSDVEATVALARLIRDRQPRLWNWAFKNRTKDCIKRALENGPVLWVNPRFGQERGCCAVVSAIGVNPDNHNEVYVWDLKNDPAELLSAEEEEIRARLFAKTDELPDGVKPLPVYRLSVNTAPFVCGDLRVLKDKDAQAYGIDKAEQLARHAVLHADEPKLQGIFREYADRRNEGRATMPSDADAALYDIGFPSREDERMMVRVRQSGSPQDLADDVHGGYIHFESAVYDELLFRMRARCWPETLNEEEQQRWQAFCQKRLTEGGDGYRSSEAYDELLGQLSETYAEDVRRSELLEQLFMWKEELEMKAGLF